MIRILAVLFAASTILLSAGQARGQYYIPSYVPMYRPYIQPSPYVYYRYDYGYFPRRRYRSYYYPPTYNVYIVPRSNGSVQQPTPRPSNGVHPSHYFGNPHASQNIANPHRSQTLP